MLLAGYYCCTTAIFEIYPAVAMLMTREKKNQKRKQRQEERQFCCTESSVGSEGQRLERAALLGKPSPASVGDTNSTNKLPHTACKPRHYHLQDK